MPSNARAKLGPFKALIDRLRAGVAGDPGAADAIERVIEETGYADRLRLEGEEGEDRLENLMELAGGRPRVRSRLGRRAPRAGRDRAHPFGSSRTEASGAQSADADAGPISPRRPRRAGSPGQPAGFGRSARRPAGPCIRPRGRRARRRGRPGRHAAPRLPRAARPGGRRRRGGRRRPRLADDPARGQGARIRRGLDVRDGGARLPVLPLAGPDGPDGLGGRGSGRDGRGAPAFLRGHDARPKASHAVPWPAAVRCSASFASTCPHGSSASCRPR